MQCPECDAAYSREDRVCPECGVELPVTSTSIVPVQRRLPAALYHPQVPRGVVASVGAVALGVGLELLRRNVLVRLQRPGRSLEQDLPPLGSLKDILFPGNTKPIKPPRGYEVHETVIVMRRVIRRQA